MTAESASTHIGEPRLREILGRIPLVKIAVFGDYYLDRYGMGAMEAISREAPVPIVRLKHKTSNRYSPGGAGNAAMNAADLGAQVWALSVVGDDLYGRELKSQLWAKGICVDGLIEDDARVTGAFEKFYASAYHSLPQQVARVDTENEGGIRPESEERLARELAYLLDRMDGMIVADYAEVPGTGCVTARALGMVCERAHQADKVIVGDSRDRIAEFRAILGVPNDYEAAMAAGLYRSYTSTDIGDEIVAESGRVLTRRLGKELAITRGRRGIAVFDRQGEMTMVPTRPAEGRIDPTGAGDTVSAAVAGALCAGATLVEAAAIANLAAGVTVRKLGQTGTATPPEILCSFRAQATG